MFYRKFFIASFRQLLRRHHLLRAKEVLCLIAFFSLASCAASISGSISPYIEPESDGVPVSARRFFVTATFTDGDIGGVVGGDAKCQSEADSAGLNRTYRAVISVTSSSAISRLGAEGKVYLKVGDNFELLAESVGVLLQTPTLRTAKFTVNGDAISGSAPVYTGMEVGGGIAADNCQDFTGTGGISTWGDPATKNSNFVRNGLTTPCNLPLRLYCISGQDL
jgi:hypothetical protein